MAVTFPVLSHRFRREQLGDIHASGVASIGRAFLPWVGLSANKCMIRNVSLTLGKLANSTAKAIAAQQPLLDLLTKIVLDNYIALDYLPAEERGIYAIASTFFTWINISGEVETQLQKIREQVHWLQQISPDCPWSFNLFSWLTSGLGSWFRMIIQTGFVILL